MSQPPRDASPPLPTVGEGQGSRKPGSFGFPPPPTPPHKGEGSEGADVSNTIWRFGRFEADAWTKALVEGPLGAGPAIVSKTRWLAERETIGERMAPLGLQLEPGEALDDLATDLPRFKLIALNFPKYSDGRAFSTARLLREKYGYAGELRAVGNVLNDQVAFMWRVGFDSLEVTHAPTRQALIDGSIAQVKLYYQPAGIAEPPAGTRPWLRRAKG